MQVAVTSEVRPDTSTCTSAFSIRSITLAAPFTVIRFGVDTGIPVVYPSAVSPFVVTVTGRDAVCSSSSSTWSTLSTIVMLILLFTDDEFAVTVIFTAFVIDNFDISAIAVKSEAPSAFTTERLPFTIMSTVSPDTISYN